MSEYKFKAGQSVTMTPRRIGQNVPGRFQIVRTLPATNGDNQYRIKSTLDGHERVVTEAEIA